MRNFGFGRRKSLHELRRNFERSADGGGITYPKPNKAMKVISLVLMLFSLIGLLMPAATLSVFGERTESAMLADIIANSYSGPTVPMFILYMLCIPALIFFSIIGLVISDNKVNRIFFGITKFFAGAGLFFSFIGTISVVSEVSDVAAQASYTMGMADVSVNPLGFLCVILVAAAFALQFVKSK